MFLIYIHTGHDKDGNVVALTPVKGKSFAQRGIKISYVQTTKVVFASGLTKTPKKHIYALFNIFIGPYLASSRNLTCKLLKIMILLGIMPKMILKKDNNNSNKTDLPKLAVKGLNEGNFVFGIIVHPKLLEFVTKHWDLFESVKCSFKRKRDEVCFFVLTFFCRFGIFLSLLTFWTVFLAFFFSFWT